MLYDEHDCVINQYRILFTHKHLCLCRIVDGTEDSEGTESSLTFSFSTSRGCPVSEPTSASASTTGPLIMKHSFPHTLCNPCEKCSHPKPCGAWE